MEVSTASRGWVLLHLKRSVTWPRVLLRDPAQGILPGFVALCVAVVELGAAAVLLCSRNFRVVFVPVGVLHHHIY